MRLLPLIAVIWGTLFQVRAEADPLAAGIEGMRPGLDHEVQVMLESSVDAFRDTLMQDIYEFIDEDAFAVKFIPKILQRRFLHFLERKILDRVVVFVANATKSYQKENARRIVDAVEEEAVRLEGEFERAVQTFHGQFKDAIRSTRLKHAVGKAFSPSQPDPPGSDVSKLIPFPAPLSPMPPPQGQQQNQHAKHQQNQQVKKVKREALRSHPIVLG